MIKKGGGEMMILSFSILFILVKILSDDAVRRPSCDLKNPRLSAFIGGKKSL